MIVFDTSVFLILIRKEPLMLRVQALLDRLAQSATPIGVPTIVLAELWVGSPVEARNQLLASLPAGQVWLLPFDLACAHTCADLVGKSRTIPPPLGTSNTRIKKDALIIATAQAYKATHIYTQDTDFCSLSNRVGLGCSLVEHLP